MVTQFYIVEVKKLQNGEYEHQIHWVWDENPDKALLKGWNKYHLILADAAISDTLSHAAVFFNTEGSPIAHECYEHPSE